MRYTIGGDRLEYHTSPSALAIDMLDTKIYLNSVILDSSKGVFYYVTDIKNYYLNNDIKHFQYMCIHSKYFTNEFRNE